MPTYATISDFTYPGARPLYIYVKKAHLSAIKGLQGYVAEWAKAWGPDGLLKAQGHGHRSRGRARQERRRSSPR